MIAHRPTTCRISAYGILALGISACGSLARGKFACKMTACGTTAYEIYGFYIRGPACIIVSLARPTVCLETSATVLTARW